VQAKGEGVCQAGGTTISHHAEAKFLIARSNWAATDYFARCPLLGKSLKGTELHSFQFSLDG